MAKDKDGEKDDKKEKNTKSEATEAEVFTSHNDYDPA